MRKASFTSRKLAKYIAGLTADKKAEDILVLDMRKCVNFCDYFVICSGNTERFVQAIADHISEDLKTQDIRVHLPQNMRKSSWVVFDVGDVVVHIFQKKVREFYRLEYLWQEAKPVEWSS